MAAKMYYRGLLSLMKTYLLLFPNAATAGGKKQSKKHTISVLKCGTIKHIAITARNPPGIQQSKTKTMKYSDKFDQEIEAANSYKEFLSIIKTKKPGPGLQLESLSGFTIGSNRGKGWMRQELVDKKEAEKLGSYRSASFGKEKHTVTYRVPDGEHVVKTRTAEGEFDRTVTICNGIEVPSEKEFLARKTLLAKARKLKVVDRISGLLPGETFQIDGKFAKKGKIERVVIFPDGEEKVVAEIATGEAMGIFTNPNGVNGEYPPFCHPKWLSLQQRLRWV